jgi:predicted CopG family antitoxin
MASKNIGIKEDVYERLKAHKRGDESFSEVLDRLLRDRDADWRTNVGFLAPEAAADLDGQVIQGFSELSGSLDELGVDIDERLMDDS